MIDITVIIYVYNGRTVRGNRDIRILAAESEPLITLALRRNCFTDRACLRIRFLIVVPARNLRFYIRVGIGIGNFFLPIHNRVAGRTRIFPLRRHRRGGSRHRFGNRIPPGECIAHLRGVSRSRHRSAVFQHLRLNIAAAVGVPREQVAVAVVFYFHDRFAAGRHLHLGDGQSRKALHRFRLCGGVQARGALQRFTQRFVFRISGAFHVLEQVLYRVIPGGAAVSNNDR